MRIALLTFHCAHNYGAILQCYALQKTLEDMGHYVEVIDYRPAYLVEPYKKFDVHRFISRDPYLFLKKSIRESIIYSRRVKRYNAYDKFIKGRLNLSPHKSVCEGYEAYIIGSDQVWNTKITQGVDPTYFACFPFAKGNKIYITYAVSMGGVNEGPDVNYLAKALENFDAISVREKYLQDFLQPLTSKSIEHVLDPTLLAHASLWCSIAKKPDIDKKYVAVYQVRKDKETIRIAKEIAKQIGGIVVDLDVMSLRRTKGYYCYSPEEFLGWLKYASCVVTTSFHGTAFSLIFQRPFYCISLGGEEDMRPKQLLTEVGLSSRFIPRESTPSFSEIDYCNTISTLNSLRELSKAFLYNALTK